jgi:hypothetical protein
MAGHKGILTRAIPPFGGSHFRSEFVAPLIMYETALRVDMVLEAVETLSGRCRDLADHLFREWLRAGPKHLTVRQWQAAQIFRSAYETLSGACRGAMDFDRVRGGGLPGQPFGERQLHAGGASFPVVRQRRICGHKGILTYAWSPWRGTRAF